MNNYKHFFFGYCKIITANTLLLMSLYLSVSAIWLYLYNPNFFDSIPFYFLSITAVSSVIIAFFLSALILLLSIIRPIHKWIAHYKWIIQIFAFSLTVLFLSIPVLLVWISSIKSAHKLENPPKLLVIGLDAATWDLLDPWMEEGKLPHLLSVREKGVSSTLMSMEPMRSPSLWTTICTGVSPEVHGVNGFFSTRSDLKTARIWDVFVANGIDVGLFGWLLTSPPESKFSFSIPAWLARTAEVHPLEYSFVQELSLGQAIEGGEVNVWENLIRAVKNGVKISGLDQAAQFHYNNWLGMDDEQHLSQKMLAEIPLQTDVFLQLLHEYQPDVATFTFYGSDKLGHRFWHYMQPENFPEHDITTDSKYKKLIEQYYRKADKAIGHMLQSIDENTTLVVLSDHGMKANPTLPRQFFLDTSELLNTIGIEELFRHHTIMRQTFLEPVIDDPLLLEETKVILQSISFEDGDPVFRVIIENGKIVIRTNFSLTWNEESPLLTNQYIQYAHHNIPVDDLFFLRTFSGAHDPRGILLMKGPHIQQNKEISDTQLTDIAPTLLFLMNQPISREIEGKVIEEAFDPAWFQTQSIEYVESYESVPIELGQPETDEALLERLRSMGYVE